MPKPAVLKSCNKDIYVHKNVAYIKKHCENYELFRKYHAPAYAASYLLVNNDVFSARRTIIPNSLF